MTSYSRDCSEGSSLYEFRKKGTRNETWDLPPVKEVCAYVVNVHDAINFDIDILLSKEEQEAYSDIITNVYRYKEEDSDKICRGKTYRCRLQGIKVIPNHRKHFLMKSAMIDVFRMIDRSNGWILCTITSVDIYSRMLIDIQDPITKESLKDLLLARYPNLFAPYHPRSKYA